MNTLFKACLIVVGLALAGTAANAAPREEPVGDFPAGIFSEGSAAGPAVAQNQAPSHWSNDDFEADE